MKVIPDIYTVLPYLQTLPFLVSLLVLHFVLFKPLLAYMDERKQATEGARRYAADLHDQIAARLGELEARLGAAREANRQVRQDAKDRALRAEAAAIAAARKQAEGQVQGALVTLARDGEEARASLQTLSRTLSRDIAAQVLGRNVSA
ncbi:MAG: ATP synthase F0 subunit B [Deltaproteobacteria bacterium]|nr:ATP synthase F0 subunit B [Deltaproteobacteria bacterium]